MPVFTNVVGTPAAPQFCEVVWRGTDSVTGEGNRKFFQIYHFLRTNAIYAAEDPKEVAIALATLINGPLAAVLSVDYVGGSFSGRYMDDPTSGESFGSNASDGTVTGDRLPNWNCVTMQIKSDGRGRNYRGSKHFGPVAESQTLEEFLTAGAVTLWDDVRTAMVASLPISTAAGNVWNMIVLSTTLSDLEANPSVFTGAWATGFIINNRVGSMLRRKKISRT